MPLIDSSRPLNAALAAQGCSFLRADDLHIPPALRQAWLSLLIDYADLPADAHLPAGGKHRFRRCGRYRLVPASGELVRLPHADYFQSRAINRRFAPLADTTFDNPFLQELIRFDFRQFPLDAAALQSDWEVQVHLIRVTARADAAGCPSPEGIHRDGAEFVAVHLTELVNAAGGEVSLYDDARRLLMSRRLERPLDGCLLNDALLWHQAAPILPQDGRHQAIRSTLTFAYHRLSA